MARGGNGEVWRASSDAGQSVAIKFLMKAKLIAYQRFRSEVRVLNEVRGVEGILPVLDSHLPPTLDEARPWYAMPLAEPLLEVAENLSFRQRVLSIAQVAFTMKDLHDREISHRDIKPGNLLIYKRRCHICDFGLVNYPSKEDLTGSKEQLGPLWTMAPEVRRMGTRADPFPADVYSLAKTLWIVLTGKQRGFDGQFDPEGALGIREVSGDLYVTPLEQLLARATGHEPSKRPNMGQFAASLKSWLSLSRDWEQHNPLQWKEAFHKLFPVSVPSRAVWEDIDSIAAALNVIGNIPNLNHLFFPGGGGTDFDRVLRSKYEPDCIELHTSYVNVIRPSKLYFESFGTDPQWNYFRLECAPLQPSGVYSDYKGQQSEELTDLGRGDYVERSAWDDNSYGEEPLPESARLVVRHFKGAFVVFQKTSQYNTGSGSLDAYDGRHNRMTADQFREYIQKYKTAFEKAGPKPIDRTR